MDQPLPRRALRVLAIATVLQALFLFFFLFPATDPEPNGLDVAVSGAPPAVVERALESRGGDVNVVPVDGLEAATAAVRDREADGAIAADAGAVVVASRASFAVAELVRTAGAAAGAQRVVDIAPLPEADQRGIAVNTVLIPIIVTSVLVAILSAGLIPEMPAPGRLGVLALSGAVGGLLAVALAYGWLDVLRGAWLAAAGLIALTVIAVATVSSGMIRLIGPAGTPLPFLLFLMLGTPASGAATAPELLPTPWYPLGLLFPPGALADALRAISAFDGTGAARDVLVLLAWTALGVALTLLADRRASRRAASAPRSGAPDPDPSPA